MDLKRGWPIWLKAILVVLGVFILSEIILRLSGITGLLSINALKILMAFSLHSLLVLDNILLFVIVLLFPVILASKFTKKISPFESEVKGKGPLYHSTITVKTPQYNYNAEGKGLIYGSIISMVYTLFDFFVLRKFLLPQCVNPCGIESIFAVFFGITYLIMGIILSRKKSPSQNEAYQLLSQQASLEKETKERRKSKKY